MIFPVLNLKTFLQPSDYNDAINILRRAQERVRDNYLCLILKHDLQNSYTHTERNVSYRIRDAIDIALEDIEEDGTYGYDYGVEDWAKEKGIEIEDADQYRIEWINHIINELKE